MNVEGEDGGERNREEAGWGGKRIGAGGAAGGQIREVHGREAEARGSDREKELGI